MFRSYYHLQGGIHSTEKPELGCLHPAACIRSLDHFHLTQLYFNSFFTILFKLFASCFGRTIIFKWKYIHIATSYELDSQEVGVCGPGRARFSLFYAVKPDSESHLPS
jgi:hypothetical protein